MQALTAAPREDLTVDQVTALLTAPALQVSAGCDLLASDLTLVADISDDLAGGTVEWQLNASIHRTCTLSLSRALVWGVDHVRPYMLLSDGTVSAKFYSGVFCLTTPQRVVGEDPETYSATGFDRLMRLNRQVGEDYTVTAGTSYYTALQQVFTDAGLTGVLIDGAADDFTLPKDRLWSLVASSTDPDQTSTPVTWLRVVNDLLTAINFRGVWCDENGLFRCSAYQAPTDRAPEWTFDADSDLTIVGKQRTVTQDVWAVPNRWVFRQTNRPDGSPTATEGDGIYTVDNVSDGPTSQDQRGLVWPSVIDYEAASQAVLESLGDRRVAADLRVTEQLEVTTTGPFPVAGHADIYTYTDAALGAARKVQAVSWSLPLDGSDMTMTWEAVT